MLRAMIPAACAGCDLSTVGFLTDSDDSLTNRDIAGLRDVKITRVFHRCRRSFPPS